MMRAFFCLGSAFAFCACSIVDVRPQSVNGKCTDPPEGCTSICTAPEDFPVATPECAPAAQWPNTAAFLYKIQQHDCMYHGPNASYPDGYPFEVSRGTVAIEVSRHDCP